MKKISLLSILILIAANLFAQNINKPAPDWLKTAVFYQIYPQSFKDVNGDGIGDIKGITQKLDYIKWLGCNAIWMNPCFESEFKDAGYDVSDFYKVASRYGTNNDLKQLFIEAHKRGMKVCLDLVAGHTSDQHPWFKASQKAEKNEFSDRYIWGPDSASKLPRYVVSKFERKGTFRRNFFECQPALNYGFGKPDSTHPWEQPVTAPGPQATRKELVNIINFWMDMGADGFRVDMAPSFIKNDPGYVETNKMWAEIRNNFQTKYKDGILIAEWGNPGRAIKAGFMMDFMIHLGGNAYSSLFFNKVGTYPQDTCYFDIDGNGTPTKFVTGYTQQLADVEGKGYLCVPTANHDFQRPNSGTRNTEEQLKVAMTFLLTLKSVPLIYYGDEIGMKFIDSLPDKEGSLLNEKNNRAGSRTPMQWNKSTNAGFSTVTDAKKMYLPLDASIKRPDVETEKQNPTSLLNFTRQLLQLKKATPALGNTANIRFLYAENNAYPLVFERTDGKSTYLIVVNPSGKSSKASIKYQDGTKQIKPVLVKGIKISNKVDNHLNIDTEQTSYGIFQIN